MIYFQEGITQITSYGVLLAKSLQFPKTFIKSAKKFSNSIETNMPQHKMLVKAPQSLNKSIVVINRTVNSIITHSKSPLNSFMIDLLEIKRGFYNLYAELTVINRDKNSRSDNNTYNLCLKIFYELQPKEFINSVRNSRNIEMINQSFSNGILQQHNNNNVSASSVNFSADPKLKNVTNFTDSSINSIARRLKIDDISKQISNQDNSASVSVKHSNKNIMVNTLRKSNSSESSEITINNCFNAVTNLNTNLKRKSNSYGYQNKNAEIAKEQNTSIWSINDITFDDLFSESSDREDKQPRKQRCKLPKKRMINQIQTSFPKGSIKIKRDNAQQSNTNPAENYAMQLINKCLKKYKSIGPPNTGRLMISKRLQQTIQEKSNIEKISNVETTKIDRPAKLFKHKGTNKLIQLPQKSILSKSINDGMPKNKCIQFSVDYQQSGSSNRSNQNISSSVNKKSNLCQKYAKHVSKKAESELMLSNRSKPTKPSEQPSTKSDSFNLPNQIRRQKIKQTNENSSKLINNQNTQKVNSFDIEQQREIVNGSDSKSKMYQILPPSTITSNADKSLKKNKPLNSLSDSSLTHFLNNSDSASFNDLKISKISSNLTTDSQYPFSFSSIYNANTLFNFNGTTQATANPSNNSRSTPAATILNSSIFSSKKMFSSHQSDNFSLQTTTDTRDKVIESRQTTFESEYPLSTKSIVYEELLRADQHLNFSSESSMNSSGNSNKDSTCLENNQNMNETNFESQQQTFISSIVDPIQLCSSQLETFSNNLHNSQPMFNEINEELDITLAPPVEFM